MRVHVDDDVVQRPQQQSRRGTSNSDGSDFATVPGNITDTLEPSMQDIWRKAKQQQPTPSVGVWVDAAEQRQGVEQPLAGRETELANDKQGQEQE
eukprot:gene26284-10972_t